jgi:uncharacterized membrane protein YhaH (DUF805 family)
MRRRDFWLALVLTELLMALPLYLASIYLVPPPPPDGDLTLWGLQILAWIVPFDVVFALLFAPAAIRRAHDLNLSGWWGLLMLLPPTGLWLLFADGTRGANRFGPSPKISAPST